MKNILCFLLLSFSSLILTAQDNFEIKATLKNLPSDAKIALSHDGMSNTAAISPIVKGTFTAKGAVNFAGRAYFNITTKGKTKAFEFFLGNEKVTITGDANNENSLVVKGGKNDKAYAVFKKDVQPSMNKLIKIVQAAGPLQNNPTKMDSLMKLYNTYTDETKVALNKYATKYKNSPVSGMALYSLKDLYATDILVLDSLVKSLEGDAATNAYTEALKSDLEAKLFGAEGTMAIDFTQNDTADKPVKLSDFKGKYVLIDFWASWCGPCRNENPNVVAAFNKFKEKNFTILGVSLDRPGRKADWLNAIKDDGLTWTNVSDLKFWQNEAAQLYKVKGIPQNYLIGPDGKIVGKNLRGPALEEKLCQLLGCN